MDYLKNIDINGDILNAENIIILIHGYVSSKNSGTINYISNYFLNKGYATVKYDLISHGENAGSGENLRMNNLLAQLKIVVDYVRATNSKANISVFGSSFGAYIALNFIQKYDYVKFKNIVLKSPAINMKDIFRYDLLKTDFEEFKQNNLGYSGKEGKIEVVYDFYEDLLENDLLKKFDKNDKIIIAHGNIDDTASVEDSKKFAENNNVKLHIFEGMNHRMNEEELNTIFKQVEGDIE